ncbi:apurinic endonuclease (APN1) subfamily protein [Acanthamoeba castellanii str. Neff]|uniref:Apurinic endonuclease (APN1) subfamily protein n=1 Tax=Acanthamoeba castellanii (strain ATCC 30010 / Neff) TaxID=1257118 RepID=L8H794_ACACF|nr:apurinic endonuclease (APN1) subfamily protein [Acanthamoeba castellanii str. Neff]ELR21015.1 apurinic endonuclease (APN1) subfamily protein [Acanthamoeba castellanii str. Neff]
MLNIHPGSTKGKISIAESCKVIADAINEAHSQVADVSVILEITAGGGNAVGKTFEELKMIIDGVTNTGYDIRTQEAYDATMAQFEEVVGLKYLKAIHLNDSKAGLGSKVDRHENIGKGYVGLEAFRCLMNDDRMNGIPLVLETPEGSYREEVKLLYSLEGKTEPYPPAPDAPEKEKKKPTKKATATKRKKKESESEEDEQKPKSPSAKKATPRRAKTTNPKSEYDDDDDFQPIPKKRRLAKRTKKPAARAKEEEEDSDT